MDNEGAGDFAAVGIHRSRVVLEANEWDFGIGAHYVVTLYLEPEEALQLAEKLTLCAIGMQQEIGTYN